MDRKEIAGQADQLKADLLSLMNRIVELSAANDKCPEPTDSFGMAKKAIEHPSYDIVVCGEVKKGKSTLLNAIIGQDVLPVDNEIATSQVFRITNSETESFALVFSDGSQRPVNRDELAKYGSQVNANLQGDVDFAGKILSYIQVNVPVAFLPDNVSLVDTPGLGAIYKSHEWITQNYVKRATAVLFVFDTRNPLVKQEKIFIEKVLDITPHVMFVMTKIDTVTPAEWTSLLRRTEESLVNEIFKPRKLSYPTIFPVSGKTLRDAAEEEDADFKAEDIRMSGFSFVKEELMTMIVKAVALSHTSVALYESQNQVLKAKAVIADLLKVSADDGQQLDRQLKSDKQVLQNRLQQEWGAESNKNRQMADDINRICNNVTNRVSQMFRMTSPIRQHYMAKIEGLSTMEQVEELGKTMPQAVVNDVAVQWESIMSDAEREVSAVISMAKSQMDAISYNNVYNDSSAISAVSLTFKQKLACFRNDVFTNAFVGGLVGLVFAPLGAAIAIGATIWNLITGGSSKDAQIKQNKSHFITQLSKLLDRLNSQLCDVNDGHSRSIVNEFIFSLKKAAEQALSDSMESKKQEMQEQIEMLENQARLDIESKRRECERLNRELTQWNDLVPMLRQLCDRREIIERELKK